MLQNPSKQVFQVPPLSVWNSGDPSFIEFLVFVRVLLLKFSLSFIRSFVDPRVFFLSTFFPFILRYSACAYTDIITY